MSTVHANSAADTISRLETMILMAVELPIHAIRRQIGSGVDIIVHLGRMRDRSRRVLEIVELSGNDTREIEINPLFEFKEDAGSTKDVVTGRLHRTGRLKNEEKLKSAGIYSGNEQSGTDVRNS